MSSEVEEYRLLVAEVYELAGLSRRSSERLAREQGQTAARWHVMSVISEEPLSASAIARRLGLARQSVQRVVDDLAASGHVGLDTDPRDRRAPLVSLTPSGKASLSDLFESSHRDRVEVLESAGLSATRLAQTRTTLRILIDALTEGPG